MATYTNPIGLTSTLAFAITVNSTAITPYLEVDGGAWQNVAAIAVNYTDTVNLAPWPTSGGTWSWAGPNNFMASTREITSIALPSGTNTYTATYTNPSGVQSTQTFIITVNSTPITPYLQVDGGVWHATNSIVVDPGNTVNLAPWPLSGGTWSWSGPNDFSAKTRAIYGIALPFGTNTYTATYTNPSGVTNTQAFVITVNSTPITPYLEVNGRAWQNVASVAVNYSDTVNIAPWPTSGGSWSWTGPDNFMASTREITGVALPASTNTYMATYTNPSGVASTQAFVITVNSTPITPYLQVDNGPWQSVSSVTCRVSDTVNLGPWPQSGGRWSWTGPNGYNASMRAIYGIPLTSGTNTYTATYTNPAGVQSTETFTITAN
jgi:hypothetical protein